VDLINLLDLQVLQGNDEDDEGLELAAVPTDRDVRPEVDGQEGDKFDGELFIVLFLCFSRQYQNSTCIICVTCFIKYCELRKPSFCRATT